MELWTVTINELANVVYRVLQQAQAKRIMSCNWIIDTANETARYIIKVSNIDSTNHSLNNMAESRDATLSYFLHSYVVW